jgi:hypothetical protein
MGVGSRHHFVPQMIIRNFADADGWLHGFDKHQPARGVFRSRPQNVFVEKHLYSEFDRDGSLIPTGEDVLGRLEATVAPIIRKIIAAAREQRLPELSGDERGWWDLFFFLQWKRVPDMHKSVSPDEMIMAELGEAATELLAKFPDRREEIEQLWEAPAQARMLKRARLNALLDAGDLVPKTLATRGIVVALIPDARRSFVLGSHPVVKLAIPGATDLADPRSEMWFPIAKDVAVSPGSDRDWEIGVVLKEHRLIRHLNTATAIQSSAIVGPSAALVRSLSSAR